MNYTTRDIQARVNAILSQTTLGKPLVVDGMMGPNTRKGINTALAYKQVKTAKQLFHESGLHAVIWHWSGGLDTPTEDDLDHYNDMFDKYGNQYDGSSRAEHQANYDWRKGIGASHTRNANTGRIGMAVAGMHQAEGWPALKWGENPITWEGIDAMLERTADYCREFDIPVSRWSTLSHAEVEQTLGIRQKNKWDFMVLPGFSKPVNAVQVGDMLRTRLKERFSC
jgi:hypothetical protein